MAAAEIIGAIGSALGGAAAAASAGNSIGSGVKSKKKMKFAAELNHKYSEMAAEEAYRRQMEMYERVYQDESYQNRVKQMREAGLSVGLMYGQGAQGGGAGATTGAPAGNTSQSIDPGLGAAAAENANLSRGGLALIEASRNMAQLKNIESQTNLNEATAKKAEAEAETQQANAGLLTEKMITEQQSREPMINSIKEDVKNKQVERAAMGVDIAIKRIEFEIKEGTKGAEIEKVKTNVEAAKADVEKTIEEIRGLSIDNEIKDEAMATIVSTYKAKLGNIVTDTLLKDEQIECTKQQAQLFYQEAFKAFSEAIALPTKMELEYEIAELMAKAGISQSKMSSAGQVGSGLMTLLGVLFLGAMRLPAPSRPIGFGK